MCTLSTTLKIPVWLGETLEINMITKEGAQLHVLQKVMCKFGCFPCSGLGVVHYGKCDMDSDRQWSLHTCINPAMQAI